MDRSSKKAPLPNLWAGHGRSKRESLYKICSSETGQKTVGPLRLWADPPAWIFSDDGELGLLIVGNCPIKNDDKIQAWMMRYREHGLSWLKQETSCHSLILHDKKHEKIILYRPHQSEDPIYWRLYDQQLLFSPSISGLLSTGLVSAKLSKVCLAEYLYFGFVPDDDCLVEGIHKLSPGASLVYNLNSGDSWQIEIPPPWLIEEPISYDFNYQSHETIYEYTPEIFSSIWSLQEPRLDLFLPKPHIIHEPHGLEKRWLQEFDHFLPILNHVDLQKNAPVWLQGLETWLETKMSPLGVGKYLRFALEPIFYRHMRSYSHLLESWSLFNSSFISLKLKELQVIFSPHVWLQEHLFSNISQLSTSSTTLSNEQSFAWLMLQLCSKRAINPLWIRKPSSHWHHVSHTWLHLGEQKKHIMHPQKMGNRQNSIASKATIGELQLALGKLQTGILVDENIIYPRDIQQLAVDITRKYMKNNQREHLFFKASALVALEIWMRIFIDQQGKLDPHIDSWQELLGIQPS